MSALMTHNVRGPSFCCAPVKAPHSNGATPRLSHKGLRYERLTHRACRRSRLSSPKINPVAKKRTGHEHLGACRSASTERHGPDRRNDASRSTPPSPSRFVIGIFSTSRCMPTAIAEDPCEHKGTWRRVSPTHLQRYPPIRSSRRRSPSARAETLIKWIAQN